MADAKTSGIKSECPSVSPPVDGFVIVNTPVKVENKTLPPPPLPPRPLLQTVDRGPAGSVPSAKEPVSITTGGTCNNNDDDDCSPKTSKDPANKRASQKPSSKPKPKPKTGGKKTKPVDWNSVGLGFWFLVLMIHIPWFFGLSNPHNRSCFIPKMILDPMERLSHRLVDHFEDWRQRPISVHTEPVPVSVPKPQADVVHHSAEREYHYKRVGYAPVEEVIPQHEFSRPPTNGCPYVDVVCTSDKGPQAEVRFWSDRFAFVKCTPGKKLTYSPTTTTYNTFIVLKGDGVDVEIAAAKDIDSPLIRCPNVSVANCFKDETKIWSSPISGKVPSDGIPSRCHSNQIKNAKPPHVLGEPDRLQRIHQLGLQQARNAGEHLKKLYVLAATHSNDDAVEEAIEDWTDEIDILGQELKRLSVKTPQ